MQAKPFIYGSLRICGLDFAQRSARLGLRNLSAIARKSTFRETFNVPGGDIDV